MGSFLVNVTSESVAAQIAMLLNKNNQLKSAYTATKVLKSPTTYVIELGGYDMRHLDGERKVVGCVGYEKISEDVTLFKHLCVHENYRRRGLATSLVKKAMTLATTPFMQMKVRSDNLPSLKMAEGLGFLYAYHETFKNYHVLVLGRAAGVKKN